MFITVSGAAKEVLKLENQRLITEGKTELHARKDDGDAIMDLMFRNFYKPCCKDLKNVCILIYCIFVSKRISITHTHSNTGTCLEATIESRTCVKIRESYAQTMSYRDQWSEQFQLCMS